MKEGSYSRTLIKWAEPLLNLVADEPRSTRAIALEIAVATWNAVTLEDAGIVPGAIADLKRRLARLPPLGSNLLFAWGLIPSGSRFTRRGA